MKASIIIPSYNAAERLLLNLEALNCQDYDQKDVEVIVVNNGSTDDTEKTLQFVNLKFPLKIITIEKNQGIARGRNQGIVHACGDILIFHDSDMIAAKDFISRHLAYHEQENMVVCGAFWKRIRSFDYNDPEKKAQLITREQVRGGSFMDHVFDSESDFVRGIRKILGRLDNNLTGYTLPWRFCITNNLSARRNSVINVGMFDQNIVKYGFEDYDLGLRLFKAGGEFVIAEDIISAHQDHPANYTATDMQENISYICKKYNNIYFLDVILVCLMDYLEMDDEAINRLMLDINAMLSDKKNHDILESFLFLLEGICRIVLDRDFDYYRVYAQEFYKSLPRVFEHVKKLSDYPAFRVQYNNITQKMFNASILPEESHGEV